MYIEEFDMNTWDDQMVYVTISFLFYALNYDL